MRLNQSALLVQHGDVRVDALSRYASDESPGIVIARYAGREMLSRNGVLGWYLPDWRAMGYPQLGRAFNTPDEALSALATALWLAGQPPVRELMGRCLACGSASCVQPFQCRPLGTMQLVAGTAP